MPPKFFFEIKPQNEPKHELSLKNWTRIWFSKNPSTFITDQNLSRIKDFLKNFPDRHLTLIYDSNLLNEAGQSSFKSISNELHDLFQHRISFLDFSSKDFSTNLSEKEKAVYEIANHELRNLGAGGNVAAASDIVRTLSPSYRAGIYTDFDVFFKENTNSIMQLKSIEPIVAPPDCNDVLLIDPSINENSNHTYALEKYHRGILKQYENKLSIDMNLEGVFANTSTEDKNKILKLFDNEEHKNKPLLIKYRSVLESVCNSTEYSSTTRKACQKLYMDSVILITGPSSAFREIQKNSADYKKLTNIVIGQSDGIKNDASWIEDQEELKNMTTQKNDLEEPDTYSSPRL